MTNEEAKCAAYRDVYMFLHYDYNCGKKTKEQVVQDIKDYCVKKSKEIDLSEEI